MFKRLSKTLLLFLLVIFTCICCNKKSEYGIPYSLLITGDEVKKSGELLQGLPLGLNEFMILPQLIQLLFQFMGTIRGGMNGYIL